MVMSMSSPTRESFSSASIRDSSILKFFEAARIAGGCATAPMRETLRPMSIAGRRSRSKRPFSRKIWPSVIEIRLVGM